MRFLFAFLISLFPHMALADWAFDAPGRILSHSAMSCGQVSNGRYCLELGCVEGGDLMFHLNALEHSTISEANKIRLNLSVSRQLLPAIEFLLAGEVGLFFAPFEERHLPGLDRLKAGSRAEAIFWMGPVLKGAKGPVSLRGSSKAIDAALAACPLPDFAARDLERRKWDDPQAAVRLEMAEQCRDAGTTPGAPKEGFVTEVDADGIPPIDLLVNHGAVPCLNAPSLVCGSAGCLHSLWIGQDNGRYVRVLRSNIHGLSADGSGQITLNLHGGACGLVGAEPCAKRFQVFNDRLELLE